MPFSRDTDPILFLLVDHSDVVYHFVSTMRISLVRFNLPHAFAAALSLISLISCADYSYFSGQRVELL